MAYAAAVTKDSWSKVPDNITKECPNRMADGRHFTDYRPRCSQVLSMPTPMGSFEFRQHLIHNAVKIMDASRNSSIAHNSCPGCPDADDQGTMLAEQYMTTCTKQTCWVTPNDHCGLGTGRRT
jgi:hypothetical protein